MSCNFCKHINKQGITQYCPKVGNKEIIYDQSPSCPHYDPVDDAPEWCWHKIGKTSKIPTPRTNKIWGGLLSVYTFMSNPVDETAEMERDLMVVTAQRDELLDIAIAASKLDTSQICDPAHHALVIMATEIIQKLHEKQI